MRFDPFGYKRLASKIEEIQHQHYNLLHIIQTLARGQGIEVQIHEPPGSKAYVAFVTKEQPLAVRMVPFPSGLRIFTKDKEYEVKP